MSILRIDSATGHERWRPTAPWDRNRPQRGGLATLLVGGGAAARTVARDLRRSPDYGLRPIGFLDDDPRVRSVSGIPMLGRLNDLSRIVQEHNVEAIVIAIPSLQPAKLSALVREAADTGAHVRFLPSFLSALERAARAVDMRVVNFQQPAWPPGAPQPAADGSQCPHRCSGSRHRCRRFDRPGAVPPDPELQSGFVAHA